MRKGQVCYNKNKERMGKGMNKSRRILLEHAVNVRDLGGYPTAHGKATAFGRFFRADNMYGLSEQEKDRLYQAGIRTIIDLRTPGECSKQPNSFSGYRDVQVINCSLLGESTDGFTGFLRSLGENYSEMIVRDKEKYQELFTHLCQAVLRGGVLFHCLSLIHISGILGYNQ